jgi:hypothetical protein
MEKGTIPAFFEKFLHIFQYPAYSGNQSLSILRQYINEEFDIGLFREAIIETNQCLKEEYQNSAEAATIYFESLIVRPLMVIHTCKLYQDLESCLKDSLIWYFDFSSYWLTPSIGDFFKINITNQTPGQTLKTQIKKLFDSLAPSNDYS